MIQFSITNRRRLACGVHLWIRAGYFLTSRQRRGFRRTRLLHCDKSKSIGDPDAGNLLIQGDNLEALKALLPYYAGAVKCIYIDPPIIPATKDGFTTTM